MRISYNRTTDTLEFMLCNSSATTRELGDGIVAGFDAAGRLIGFQVPDAMRRIEDLSALQQVVLEGLGPPVAQGQPPSTIVASHIVLDQTGVAWIEDTNVKVIE